MTRTRPASRRIVILAGDADGNLGDRAIVAATCALLREVAAPIELAVTSKDPGTATAQYGACTVLAPGLAGLPAWIEALRRADLALVAGGGLFQDDDSLVKMPYWAARVAAARALAGRAASLAVGVGPLTHGSSRASARLAFGCLDPIGVRDPRALALSRTLTSRPLTLMPDPALALVPASPHRARGWLVEQGVPLDGTPLLGVALRRWFPPRARIIPHKIAWKLGLARAHSGPEADRLARAVAQVLDTCVDRHGARIVFLPTYRTAHEADVELARRVRTFMRHAGSAWLLQTNDVHLLKACLGQLSAVLGGRMHAMILAAAMGTPVVGLAYNPKFHGFMELAGQHGRTVDVPALLRDEGPSELTALIGEALTGPRLATGWVDEARVQLTGFLRALVTARDGR